MDVGSYHLRNADVEVVLDFCIRNLLTQMLFAPNEILPNSLDVVDAAIYALTKTRESFEVCGLLRLADIPHFRESVLTALRADKQAFRRLRPKLKRQHRKNG